MNSLSSVHILVNFIKERSQVIAYSPALDISTVGKSEEQAKTRFNELVQMFLKDITERNVMDEVLTELGWTKTALRNERPHWTPPVITSMDLQVPMAA